MSNVITGQVAFINQPVTNNNYTSQSVIVLVEPGQYQTYVELSFGGQNGPGLIQQLVPGGIYNFHINLRGSKQMLASTKVPGNNVAFNSISVWKVEQAGQQAAAPQPAQGFQQPAPQQGFQQPAQQGGYMGQPQQTQPAQQGFAQPQQPAPQAAPQGFGAPQPAQGFGDQQPQGFGQPAQPQQQAAPGFGNPPANGFGQQ